MPKMNGSVRTSKFKEGDKNKSNKLMSFRIDDEKLLEKYKAIGAKIEYLKNIELNALLVNNDRQIKNKRKAYGNKIYTNFCGLNVPENDIECESFTVIFNDSLLVYDKKYYLQVYLDNFVYKTVNKQMAD